MPMVSAECGYYGTQQSMTTRLVQDSCNRNVSLRFYNAFFPLRRSTGVSLGNVALKHHRISRQRLLSASKHPHNFIISYIVLFHLRAAPKNRYTCPFGTKNRHILKSSQKRTPRALSLVQNSFHLFVPDEAQVHPSLSTLLDFQLFSSFF